MCAAIRSDWARSFKRQSQRVTRRSAPVFTIFQPLPSQSGHTTADTVMNLGPSFESDLTVHRERNSCKSKATGVCAEAVEEEIGLWRSEENVSCTSCYKA